MKAYFAKLIPMNSIEVRLHAGKVISSLQVLFSIQKSPNSAYDIWYFSFPMSLDTVQLALKFPSGLHSTPSATKSATENYVRSQPPFQE